MPKSSFAEAVDEVQDALKPYLRARGFKARGRSFNRTTDDGLTQVIGIQMGASDPPGTTYIPGLRENLHGLFAINLGVYVPEVAEQTGSEAKSWVQEYHCCVRSRLGELIGEGKEVWWQTRAAVDVVTDLQRSFELAGFPFLERFESRDRILAEWAGRSQNMGASRPPRIVSAIILAKRGMQKQARELLSQQAHETRNSGHPQYVRQLAESLGLGRLDE
jgi:Domain of unknown function (DUF4304)